MAFVLGFRNVVKFLAEDSRAQRHNKSRRPLLSSQHSGPQGGSPQAQKPGKLARALNAGRSFFKRNKTLDPSENTHNTSCPVIDTLRPDVAFRATRISLHVSGPSKNGEHDSTTKTDKLEDGCDIRIAVDLSASTGGKCEQNDEHAQEVSAGAPASAAPAARNVVHVSTQLSIVPSNNSRSSDGDSSSHITTTSTQTSIDVEETRLGTIKEAQVHLDQQHTSIMEPMKDDMQAIKADAGNTTQDNGLDLRLGTSFENLQLNIEIQDNQKYSTVAGEQDKRDDEDLQGEDDKPETLERHDWEVINAIPDVDFKRLLLQWEDTALDTDIEEDCHVLQHIEGAYNHIVFMYTDTQEVKQYVIKVPAIGSEARWQEGDAHNLRSECGIVEHILKCKLNVPVPEIISYDDTFFNPISAPYVLMKRLAGIPAYKMWDPTEQERDHISASRVSAETRQKRITFLRSLAKAMTGLSKLEYNMIGMPDFGGRPVLQEPEIMHSYRWTHPDNLTREDLTTENQLYKFGPFTSSKEYMTHRLDGVFPSSGLDPELYDTNKQNYLYGIRKILDIIYAHPCIAFSKKHPDDAKETFVLRHTDLDLQNILVNDEGEVTGILDWEGCMTAPRCIGYATLPVFLMADWQVGFTLQDAPCMPSWELDFYRDIYTEAIFDAGCLVADARYTRKSGMYRAIAGALDDGGDAEDLVKNVLLEIPGTRRMDLDKLIRLVGIGWEEAEEYLKIEINKVLEPEDRVLGQ